MGHGAGEAKDGVRELYTRWFIEYLLGIRPEDRLKRGEFMSILFTALFPMPRTSANK